MEKSWTRFIFTARKLTQLLNAVSRSRKDQFAAPELNPSPVSTANLTYIPVSKPDVIAQLCIPTGDEQIDHIHVILIDLVQKDLIGAVRIKDGDNTLRYYATQAGKKFVGEQFQEAIDTLLERIFGDDR